MKRLNITAQSPEEAKVKALEQGVTVIYDATPNWKRAQKPVFDKPLTAFAVSIMTRKRFFAIENAGIIITLTPGKEDTKIHPYKYINFIRKGRCKLKRTIEIRSKKTHEVFGTAPDKRHAKALARKIVIDKRVDVYAKTVYEADDVDFIYEYYPSAKTTEGNYVVFSSESRDVELYQKKLFTGKHASKKA